MGSEKEKKERSHKEDKDHKKSKKDRDRDGDRKSKKSDRKDRDNDRKRDEPERSRSEPEHAADASAAPFLPPPPPPISDGKRPPVHFADDDEGAVKRRRTEIAEDLKEAEPKLNEASAAKKKAVDPASLEDKLKELKDRQLEPSKPKFLTKAERQQLALQKLEEQRLERQLREEEERKARENLNQRLRERSSGSGSGRDGRDDRDRRPQERERDNNTRERDSRGAPAFKDRATEEREREEMRKKREADRVAQAMEDARTKEQNAIKERYLGVKHVKKRVVKLSDKFRFSFDWEVTDDTSRDLNPIYSKKHEAQLLFGRGMKAGIDRREQKKTSTYVDELEKLRNKHGQVGGDEDEEMEEYEPVQYGAGGDNDE